MNWLIFANWTQGEGFSGGDSILVNLFKNWTRDPGDTCTIITSESGESIYKRAGLSEKGRVSYEVISSRRWERSGIFPLYIIRTLTSLKKALIGDFSKFTHIYSSSDFWPESLAGLTIKLRYPKITWVAAIYLIAPNPFYGFFEGSRKVRFPKIKDIFYFLTQKPIIWILKHRADRICVTSTPDTRRFKNAGCGIGNIVVVRGGVDTGPSKEYIREARYKNEKKSFDACFIGRFHRQKGVIELMEIWKILLETLPHAKLALIGDGPLMSAVRKRISDYGITNNIFLSGFQSGETKFEIFKNSKVVLHPAVYDSGGMAAAEAMAFGLPAVGFDLEAYKTYYPAGMLKANRSDLADFAEKIKRLLTDQKTFEKIQKEAIDLVKNFWDYEKRAKDLYPLMSAQKFQYSDN